MEQKHAFKIRQLELFQISIRCLQKYPKKQLVSRWLNKQLTTLQKQLNLDIRYQGQEHSIPPPPPGLNLAQGGLIHALRCLIQALVALILVLGGLSQSLRALTRASCGVWSGWRRDREFLALSWDLAALCRPAVVFEVVRGEIRNFWAAAPNGMKSCRTWGGGNSCPFVHLSVCLFVGLSPPPPPGLNLAQGGLIHALRCLIQALRGLILVLGGLSQALGGLTRALRGLCQALGGLNHALGGLSQASGGMIQSLGGLSQASEGMIQVLGDLSQGSGLPEPGTGHLVPWSGLSGTRSGLPGPKSGLPGPKFGI